MKKRPIRIKKSVEDKLLAEFALADELTMYLKNCGFSYIEITELNMNLYCVKKGR